MFSLKLLGGAALEKDGVPVTGRAVHRRRLALLAVLAAARGRTVGRERIVGYLWPDHPGDAARHLLSESLYILRKAIGESAFIAAGDELGLDPAVVRSDVFAFSEALEADDPARAVAAYGGPFLDGFTVADAPEFERWAEEERGRLERAHARALEALAEAHEAEGDPLAAAEWWRRVARTDPFSSRVALRLMRALEAGGERAAALRHAAVHAGLVRQELETEPDPEIEALARRLREAPRPAPAPPPLVVAPRHAGAAAVAAPAAPAMAATTSSAGAVAVVEEEAEAEGARPERRAAPAHDEAEEHEPAPARRRRPLTAFAIVAAMAISLVFILQRPSPAGVDASSYIVLPFVQRSGAGAGLTPDQAELLLHTALSQWNDVRLVDGQRARDLLARHGTPGTLSEARKIAREAGAGRLLWGEITPLGDSVMVRAALYDVARSRADVREHVVHVGRDLRGATASMGQLASALMGRGGIAGAADASAGTRSLAALQAYQRGRLALSRWDLGRARNEFAQAVALDPGYAAAHLWMAQAEAWQDERDGAAWREPAARAVADSARLSPRERALARALVALGERRFPDACRAYDAVLQRDSADFAAWFGLGECHRRDQLVVADPSSPSGWRFRGSFHRAIEAYGRALRTVPSSLQAFRGAGFWRLNQLLNTDDRVVRDGFAPAGSDTLRFAGYPFLQGDTVAVVPWRAEEVAALRKETIPPGKAAAAERNRRLLGDVLMEWVRAFPQNPDAHEALALALEAMGEIRVVRQGQPSAFSELRLARELTNDRDQRLRLAVAQARLYLRVAEYARARALADSVLGEWRDPGARDAELLAPLALLAGRVERAGELLRASAPEQYYNTPDGRYLRVPVPVAQAHADAVLFSGLGLGREAAEAEARLERLVAAWAPPAQRPAMRSALLSAPRRLGFPHGASRVRSAPLQKTDFMVEPQQMLARGDAAGARARLAEWYARLGARRPGDVTFDFAIPAAQLHLSLGDTARAVDELDRALLALEAMPVTVLERVHETSALLRAMQLRSAVAQAQGDRRTAAQWRAALSTLWAGGDPRLRAMLR